MNTNSEDSSFFSLFSGELKILRNPRITGASEFLLVKNEAYFR